MVVPHPIIAGRKTLLRVPISLSTNTQADDTLSYSGVGAVRNVGLHLGRILNKARLLFEGEEGLCKWGVSGEV